MDGPQAGQQEVSESYYMDDSLHHFLLDSTQHRKHSVIGTLEFVEPISTKDRWRKWLRETWSECRRKNWYQWLKVFLPCFWTLEGYRLRDLPIDLLSGFTVGAMVIPQGMSYAKLAGLPVEYGLYAALTPTIGYALFGTCQQLAVGPVAVLSLLVSTGLSPLFDTEENLSESQQEQYNILAIQTSMMTGAIMMLMGILRLGFISSFISHAVTSGLTSGAAIIIAASQLKYIFGVDCPRADDIVAIMKCLVHNGGNFKWKPFVLGASVLLFLIALRMLGDKFPRLKYVAYLGPFIAMSISIILSYTLDFAALGFKTVGHIPSGLPMVTIPWWHPFDSRIMKTVFLGIIVGFMESISIARQLAAKNGYTLDTSRELLGLGAANFFGSMFQSYPATGSFSRSAIKQSVGTKSILSGIFVALFVGLTLLFLTPIFEYMPYATFASIIISAALFFFDYSHAIHLWRVDKLDLLTWLTCFMVTLFVGVDAGIGVSVGLSLLFVLYETAYPHTARLGRLKESSVYRNVKQYPEAQEYDGIVIMRFDAPLYFANSEYTREKMAEYEQKGSLSSRIPIKFLILDMSPVSYIDSSGLTSLEDILSTYGKKDISLLLCNPNRPVMDKFVLSGMVDKVGSHHFFVSVHDAVNYCLKKLGDEEVSTVPASPPGELELVGEVPSRLHDD